LANCWHHPVIHHEPLQFFAQDSIQTYTINGQTFHQLPPVRIPIGTNQEWTLTALTGSHLFHIHVNPFQVVSYTDPSGLTLPMDVWRDTLYIPEGGTYTIRSRFRDFVGDSVLHCHILDHEDQGMMMCLRFYDPKDPNAPVQGPGCDSLIAPNKALPAPAMRLPRADGPAFELAEARRRNVVLVFFQGAECGHCARQQLADLVRRARTSLGPDDEIVAVSARKVADPSRALQALGVEAADRFHLLVDPDHRAFRDFGCYAGGPRHGLFVIDREGLVRARYVGASPYNDNAEVIRRVKALGGATATASR
jgi:peroxiredoxin